MKLKLTILFISAFSLFVFSDIKELDEKKTDMGCRIKVFCIDGLKFVTTYSMKEGTNGTLIQVYEEKNGKVVPVRCDESGAGIGERQSSGKE